MRHSIVARWLIVSMVTNMVRLSISHFPNSGTELSAPKSVEDFLILNSDGKSPREPRMMKVMLYFSVFLVPLMLAGCSISGSDRRWTEDVQLDDGRMIQVKREVAFVESNAIGGGAYNAVETSSSIEFTGDLSTVRTWRESLMALVLYFDKSTQEWVVVATTTSCEVWSKRNKPRPMYWEFRLRQGGWQETPLSPKSIGLEANLLHRYLSALKVKHISVEERKRLETDALMGSEFRKILPETEINCMGGP